jgi:hypothetical protein
MQYSRFRSTILGTEPQKRNSSHSEKTKVSKSKKALHSSKHDISVKPESPSHGSYIYARRSISGHIKQEDGPGIDLSKLSPASFPSPGMVVSKGDMNARFLTPCSDDVSPAMTMRRLAMDHGVCQDVKGFPTPMMECVEDFMTGSVHDYPSLPHSPSFSNFDAAYDVGHDFQNHDPLLDCNFDWNEKFPSQSQF